MVKKFLKKEKRLFYLFLMMLLLCLYVDVMKIFRPDAVILMGIMMYMGILMIMEFVYFIREDKMAEDKETKEEKKEVKKLDNVKNSPENKAAIDASEGKMKSEVVSRKSEVEGKEKKRVEKSKKDKKKGKEVVELEREYVVPLRRGFLNVPKYKRAKKAIRILKEFMVRHMGVRDGDLGKVKIDMYLNNEIWFRGIKKPLSKVKVRARKVGGIVYVELAELPNVVAFAKARDIKRVANITKTKKVKKVEEKKEADADKDGVDDKKEEVEDVRSGAEKAARVEKAVSKEMKHTAQGKHFKKTMPVRKALKK